MQGIGAGAIDTIETDLMEEFLPTGAHGVPARVPPDLSPKYI